MFFPLYTAHPLYLYFIDDVLKVRFPRCLSALNIQTLLEETQSLDVDGAFSVPGMYIVWGDEFDIAFHRRNKLNI